MFTQRDTDRFWIKVATTESKDCWEWLAGKYATGYGAFWFNAKMKRAHRIAWELEHGPIPAGMSVLHSCDNRACVNPLHLWLGTYADNSIDMYGKGRRPVKLTWDDVCMIRASSHTQAVLASMLGVHQSLISKIIRNKLWKHDYEGGSHL